MRAVLLSAAALLVVLAAAPLASAFTAPTEAPNTSGRLATAGLYNLGNRTSALYAYASDGSSFARKLFWKSAAGKFDATRARLVCGDLNADGHADALALYNLGSGRSALYAFLSDGSTFMKTTAWSGTLAWSRAKLTIADVNGDGADDAYVLYRSSTTTSAVYRFTSAVGTAKVGTVNRVTMAKSTAWAAQPYIWSRAQIAATDANGDGKGDLVALYRTSATAARLDVFKAGATKLNRVRWWRGTLTPRATLACGDLNSDGKGDALVLADLGNRTGALRVFKSRGSSFAAPATWWRSRSGKLDWATTRVACGDVTSDGKSDAVLFSRSGLTTSRLQAGISSGRALTVRTFWSGTQVWSRAAVACAPATPLVVPATTEVLTPTTVAGATTADGSTYTFSNPTQTAGLAPGDVIIGQPTANLPEGVFRKVTAVTGGGASVATAPAYLEDTFKSASFSADHAITQSDFLTTTTATPGVQLVRSAAAGPDSRLITLRLTDVAVSRSADLTTDFGPVTVSGTITFKLTVHVSGDVGWGGVKSFVTSETSTVACDLRASVSQEVGFEKEKTLVSWGAGQLAGFTVWVGPVPLYFQPELSVFVGAKGSCQVGVTTSVHYDASGTLGVRYENGAFTSFAGLSQTASHQPPTLSASGSLKGYAGTQLGLKLYAAAGPYVRLDGYAKLGADTAKTPWWTLAAGLEGRMGAQIGVNHGFIHWNKDWHTGDVTLKEWTLAKASTPAPSPSPTPTATPTPTPTDTGTPAPTPSPTASPGGGQWSEQSSGTTTDLRSVCFVDASHGWVVGGNYDSRTGDSVSSVILATTDGGSHWVAQDSGTTNVLTSVSFVDGIHGWAVGDNETVLSTDDGGAHWLSQTAPYVGAGTLHSVSFIDASRGWAVGSGSDIMATTDGGAHWSARTMPNLDYPTCVFFRDVDHGWVTNGYGHNLSATAVGGGGAYSDWVYQWVPSSLAGLYSTHFVDVDHGWAVGGDVSAPAQGVGAVFSTIDGGASWITQTSGVSGQLFSVHGLDVSTAWAVGAAYDIDGNPALGTITATRDGGAHWAPQFSGTTGALRSVTFTDVRHGWAVGDNGTVLVYTD